MEGMIECYKKSRALQIIDTNLNDLELWTVVSKTWDGPPSVKVKCYSKRKQGSIIGFPRYFIRDFFPKYYNKEMFESRGIKAKFHFGKKLRPYQVESCEKLVRNLRKVHGGILQARGGTGKTVMALWAIAQLRQKTLIIVHTTELMRQWKQQISDCLGIPLNKIGTIQGDKCNIRKITVGMLQSLSKRNYGAKVNEGFGLVVVDECHRLGAIKWNQAIKKLGATYRLGLSATPVRRDGLEKVIRWHLGSVIAHCEATTVPVIVLKYNTGSDFRWLKCYRRGRIMLPILQKVISQSKCRNQKRIVPLINWALNKKKRNQIMVLSNSLAHLTSIRVAGMWHAKDVGYFTGQHPETLKKMTDEEKEATKKKKIILGTYKMLKEGVDIPRVDTILLATPIGDPRQVVYRAARFDPSKKDALVIDLCDLSVPTTYLWNARNRNYLNEGYKIVTWKELKDSYGTNSQRPSEEVEEVHRSSPRKGRKEEEGKGCRRNPREAKAGSSEEGCGGRGRRRRRGDGGGWRRL